MNANGPSSHGELLTKGGSLPSGDDHQGSRGATRKRDHSANEGASVRSSERIRNMWGRACRDELVRQFLRQALTKRVSRERESFDESVRSPSPTADSITAGSVNASSGVTLAGQPIIEAFPSRSTGIPRWKRTLDLAAIFLASPIWLPLMLLVMLAVRLSSSGPIFFKQRRVGYRGALFMIYKFRSMRVNAETQSHESHFERLMKQGIPMAKLDAAGDPRIIPWGRFLRAVGLDELPQIFNVLRGEMSLVGPRPCTAHEFQHFTAHERQRADAFPGLTGYWQVNGKNRTTFEEMIRMDIYYAQNMSLGFDLCILAKTVPTLVREALEIRTSPSRRYRAQQLAKPRQGVSPG